MEQIFGPVIPALAIALAIAVPVLVFRCVSLLFTLFEKIDDKLENVDEKLKNKK